jgi:hypothetical protein
MTNRPMRIATVYSQEFFDQLRPYHMATTRWIRISEALAELGYDVDVIVNTKAGLVRRSPRLRYVPFDQVVWDHYDVVKTQFHKGFKTLCEQGGRDHPFIVSKLGSVVGDHDGTEGVYFFGPEREELYAIQSEIAERSRFITVLTKESTGLWRNEHRDRGNVLFVPTGVDRVVPPPGTNPFDSFNEKIAVYLGNIYTDTQREINLLWQQRLNIVGKHLRKQGIRLCFVGTGKTDQIDRESVTCFGAVDNRKIWDYQYFANVGIVFAQGPVQHNESSKLYYYLRTGLPVVSESSVPNNRLIHESGHGLIADYADDAMMAKMIADAAYREWSTKGVAVQYILTNHTWQERAHYYDAIFKREFVPPETRPSPP